MLSRVYIRSYRSCCMMKKKAVEYAARLVEKGIYAVAFSYPVVPKGKARIRTQLCAEHTREDIDRAVKAFKGRKRRVGRLTGFSVCL